ncbi:ECF RNA polymerase sigma factor SigW [Neobacillus rhizosphaerae]|uniref:ECF RNA polymerase sigma factor SigW n=1 Tax=Neobacillus rhizosphaerae TaxID=2880965 RepID=A0ABN8KP50_9BACI|nr:sigma-70 family RNA polymerase sigma factor [Neobacillus rhizosphaerae]CAH2715366.1 ECF RNA polymerase sigma factor SigW [Neobacillus rhizosphaerae]
MKEDDLQKWLEQMVAGDQEAFEHIYEITCKDVYRTVAFFVSNRQDIDELVNEVYIQMWKSLHTYDKNRSFRFWLHGLIVRQVKEGRRKAWRRFRIMEKNKTFLQKQDYVVDGETLQIELQSELTERVKALSYKHREVVILRYFHDYRLDEMSLLLEIPIGTVKSRLHTALKLLKKDMESIPIGRAGNINGF